MVKNIITIFSIVVLLGLGYYLYLNQGAASLDFVTSQTVSEQLTQNTQMYIERQRLLQEVQLDFEIFSDERFRNLQSFELPVPLIPSGREQLFDANTATPSAVISDES